MLTLKYLPIQSFSECVVYVNKDCNVYKVDDIEAMTRVEIHGGVRPLSAFLSVVDDDTLIAPDELGCNAEAFRQLNLPEGTQVSMVLTERPQSLDFVHKKIMGNVLSESEYQAIFEDIRNFRYAHTEIASFLTGITGFSSMTEIPLMVKALNHNRQIYWDEEDIVADCESLGLIAGNTADIIATAIVAAYGLPIPKTLMANQQMCCTTANATYALCNTALSHIELAKCVKENRGALVDYSLLPESHILNLLQTMDCQLGLNDTLMAVVRMLTMKLSVGITHLLIDIPVGQKALIKNAQEAIKIRKILEYCADILGLKIDVVVTDGREPIGAGIGSWLEAKDIMQILGNKPDAPADLTEKALFIAGRILEFDPKMRGGHGYKVAKEILTSGRALETFNRIIKKQGRAENSELGTLVRDVLATSSGKITKIDIEKINKIGVIAGAMQYSGAGLYLLKKVGDRVNKGDVLYRVFTCNSADFALVKSFIDADNGYEIGR